MLRIRGFRFLTEKPVLLLVNVGESTSRGGRQLAAEAGRRSAHAHTRAEAISARIEMEIGELDEAEAAAFRADLGLGEPSLDRVIRASYALLGLISFFTAGPDETRAWTLTRGASAVDAAGAIHSDLARGFIRAEVIGWQELLSMARWPRPSATARCRAEGRTYRRPGRRRHRDPLQRLRLRGGGPGRRAGCKRLHGVLIEPVVTPHGIVGLDVHEQRAEVLAGGGAPGGRVDIRDERAVLG